MNPRELTIENWQSELKRLEMQYSNFEDKESIDAQGILDNIDAVRNIIREINDKQTKKGDFK